MAKDGEAAYAFQPFAVSRHSHSGTDI